MIIAIIENIARNARKLYQPNYQLETAHPGIYKARFSSTLNKFAINNTGSSSSLCYIESYSFGKIVIDGQNYNDDVIVFPEKVRDEWWRKQGHSVEEQDIVEILEYLPDTIIFGTGAMGQMDVPEHTEQIITDLDIELIVQITSQAFKTFNEHISKGKKVVGAFHLTC